MCSSGGKLAISIFSKDTAAPLLPEGGEPARVLLDTRYHEEHTLGTKRQGDPAEVYSKTIPTQVRRKGSPALRKGYESHVTMALMADDSLLLVMTCAGSGPSTLTFSGLNKARRFLVSQSSPRRGVTCVPGINPRSRQGSTNSYVYIL